MIQLIKLLLCEFLSRVHVLHFARAHVIRLSADQFLSKLGRHIAQSCIEQV